MVKKQLEMIRFRNTCRAFEKGADIRIEARAHTLRITWDKDGIGAELLVDFSREQYEIRQL